MARERSPGAARSALLVGATGLTGARLLALLLGARDYAEVHVLARRPLSIAHPKLSALVVDFDTLAGAGAGAVPAVDDVYCCLGTTLRAAGSREAFRRVDLDHVVRVAALARERGARRFAVVSAMGADTRSAFFYNRVKGEMERTVAGLGYDTTVVVRPSLIAGERAQRRPAERAGLALARALAPLVPARWRVVPADAVARAMLAAVVAGAPGLQVLESDRLQRHAQRRGAKGRR